MKINKEGQISFLLKDGKYYISIILPKINRIYPIGDIIDIKLIPGYLFKYYIEWIFILIYHVI